MKFDTDQLYVKSTEEMAAEFAEFPRAVLHTIQVAEQCDLSLEFVPRISRTIMCQRANTQLLPPASGRKSTT